MLDVKYRFTCGDSDISEIIKMCKNILTRINWRFSFTFYSSDDDPTFWNKCQFWLKNVISLRKQLIRKVESFLKSKYWSQPRAQYSANNKPLNLKTFTKLTHFIFTFYIYIYFLFSYLLICFEIKENIQKLKWEGDWGKFQPKIFFLRQS